AGASVAVVSLAVVGSVLVAAASASFLIPICTAGSSRRVGASAPSDTAAAAESETPGAAAEPWGGAYSVLSPSVFSGTTVVLTAPVGSAESSAPSATAAAA